MSGFESAISAEHSFYQAFERGDLQLMTQVWADDPNSVCVHPGGGRLQGREAILESWGEILSSVSGLIIRTTDLVLLDRGHFSLHHLREQFYVEGQRRGVILVTNAYRQTSEGWQMVLHHGSPDPSPPPTLESIGVH